jgi:hypothetical protein
MQTVSAGFLDALRSGPSVAYRVDLLHPDLTLSERLEHVVESGSVRVGEGVIRRSVQLAIANDGRYTPDPSGALWTWTPIRCSQGVYVIDSASGMSSWEWVDVFTGYPDDPEDETVGRGGMLTITGRDRLKLAAESLFTGPLTLPASYRRADAIRIILEAAGLGADDALWDLDDGGSSLGVVWTWETGINRLEAAEQLAIDGALELFASPSGVVTLRPLVDPNVAPLSATYRRGSDFRLVGLRKRWRDLLKNHALVIGDGGLGVPVRAEVRDMNHLSTGYNPPPGHPDWPEYPRIGDRVDLYRSAGIVDAGQAYQIAYHRLLRRALVQEEIEATAIANPAHDRGDVIEVVDDRTLTAGRWVLDSFELPLRPGVSTYATRRVRELS